MWKDIEEFKDYFYKFISIIGEKKLGKFKKKYGDIKIEQWNSIICYYKIVYSKQFKTIEEFYDKINVKKDLKKQKRYNKKKESIIKYKSYINSEQWQEKRVKFFIKNKFKCSVCKLDFLNNDLNLHHHSYKRLGKEKDNDLSVVCIKCHKDLHFKNGKKIKLNEKDLRQRFKELVFK